MSANFKPVPLAGIPDGIGIAITAATAGELRSAGADFAAAALAVSELILAMPPAASQEDLRRLAAAEHGLRRLDAVARALGLAAEAIATPNGGIHAKH